MRRLRRRRKPPRSRPSRLPAMSLLPSRLSAMPPPHWPWKASRRSRAMLAMPRARRGGENNGAVASRRGYGEPAEAVAHRPPGQSAEHSAQARVRSEADCLQHHRDRALDMVRPIKRKSAARVGARVPPPVIGQRVLIGGVIGVGQLVILAFGEAAERDPQPRPAAKPLAFEVAAQRLVE